MKMELEGQIPAQLITGTMAGELQSRLQKAMGDTGTVSVRLAGANDEDKPTPDWSTGGKVGEGYGG